MLQKGSYAAAPLLGSYRCAEESELCSHTALGQLHLRSEKKRCSHTAVGEV